MRTVVRLVENVFHDVKPFMLYYFIVCAIFAFIYRALGIDSGAEEYCYDADDDFIDCDILPPGIW